MANGQPPTGAPMMGQMASRAPAPPQPGPAARPAGGGMSPVEMHKRIVIAAMKLLYSSKQSVAAVLRTVSAAQDPAQGIVQAARLIASQVAAQAKGAPPEVAGSALIPIAVLIIELAAEAGIVEQSPELTQQVIAILKGGQPQQAARMEEGNVEPGAPEEAEEATPEQSEMGMEA